MKLARKAYDVWLGLRSWFSRQDGDNFRTNRVTLAQFNDAGSASSPVALAATWACVNLNAGTIGSLPLMVYQTAPDGSRTVARDHPLYRVLHDSPNFDQTAVEFWEWAQACLELHGNIYARILRRETGGVVYGLEPVRPEPVKAQRLPDGSIEYSWHDGTGMVKVGQQDMLHIRGFGGNVLAGASTLSVLRSSFASAMSIEQAASNLFANGVRSSGVLSIDQALTGEQRAELERILGEKFVGSMNVGRPMLLDNGLKWQAIDINPVDAEMLETRKFSGEEICRIFGVPPAMVGYGDKSSNWGTGKEVDILGYQKFTLRRRAKRIEQALMKQLLSGGDRAKGIVIEFNFEGILRADSAARASFYQQALGNGWMTVNEVRALENLPPVEGGGVPRVQMQNIPLALADQLARSNADAA